MAEAGFRAYWVGSDRFIPDKGYWIEISSGRDFLGPAPSYVLIQDPVRRLCHRMIAYSISSIGQAPGKVTGIDLFYLHSMDHGTINVSHLLAQYLFRHANGRKSGARLSGGHFIGRLAMHFGLVSDEGLRGLQVVTTELPLIDLHELGRLHIYTRLNANLLKEALEIIPVDQAHQFVSPPSGDVIMDFVNQLGYPGESLCVKNRGKKTKPHVIPYSRFIKLIIYYLGRHHNIHQWSGSPLNLVKDDLSLRNLKFVPKGKINEVFGLKIPEELITDNIRNAPYYNAYLEMVTKHERRIAAVKEGGKKKTTPKVEKPMKPAQAKQAKPETAKQPKKKHVKENSTKPTPLQKAGKDQPEDVPEPQGTGEEYDLERAIQMSLESFQAHGQAHVGGVAIREPIAEATRPLLVVEGKGKTIATEEQATQSLIALHSPKSKSTTYQFIFQSRTLAAKDASTGPSAQPQDDTSANVVHDTPAPAYAETGADTDKVISKGDIEILNISKEQREDMDDQGYLEEQISILDEDQARSDLGKTLESRPLPDDDKTDEDQAGSGPRKSHFLADEQVSLEDPPSSSRTLSSMKNLDDTYISGDQFFNDKSTEDEPGKQNVDAKVISMVTVPIHQASTSVPPLSTPIIDLSPLKPTASSLPEYFTAATIETSTTTLTLPPPPQQQSITDSELAARVTSLENKFADFEQKARLLITRLITLDQGSSKQQFAPHSDQLVEDVPIPDDVNISDLKDTDTAHLPKIKTRLDWLKPLPEEDRPETPEPD
nr:hypothetical protein [Tanacetum cinerariifolium]